MGVGDDPLERIPAMDNDDEARYREYKDQLVREKQKIKRLQEIELLKQEV